jgi:hypothetical protein
MFRIMLCAVLVVLLPTMAASAEIERNNAAGFRTGTNLDTGRDISNLDTKLTDGRTLTARFAAKYPYTGAETVLGVRGKGRFSIGLADFREGQPDPPDWHLFKNRRFVRVVLGDSTAILEPSVAAFGSLSKADRGGTGEWIHVAVTLKASGDNVRARVFINGWPAGRMVRCACVINPDGVDMIVSRAALRTIQGTLSIGQTLKETALAGSTYRLPATRHEQFWGLVDDVGVFSRALTQTDALKLVSAPLTGGEPRLQAAFTFDDYVGGSTPSKVYRTTSYGPVVRTKVGSKPSRNATQNALKNVGILDSKKLRLPFKPGQAWKVTHGNSTPYSSHNGSAAFAWDFSRPGVPNHETCGQPLRALADGQVTSFDDVDSPIEPNGNQVRIKYSEYVRSLFLHIQRGSFQALYGTPSLPKTVARGQNVGLVGGRDLTPYTPLTGQRKNCHLHSDIHEVSDGSSGTVPSQYWDYQLLIGNTWVPTTVGVPQTGDIVRNPPS